MTRLLLSIFFIILLASGILVFKFGYSFALISWHVLVMTAVSIGVAIASYAVFLLVHKKRSGRILIQVLPFLYWAFVLLFYALVLGSNYFWGNTITFEILKNYLVNLGTFLNVLPIEKWILVTAIILFFLLVVLSFLLVRFRPTGKIFRFTGKLKQVRPVYIAGSAAVVILAAFLLRGNLMNAKRVLQFNQEPFVYFMLGPMWEIHSDQLLLTQPARTQADVDCINAVSVKEKNGRVAIVILVDALRSDHLPMYGYHRNTAPFLDSLFKSGKLTYVPHSFSGSTNTIGGVSSLFFSREWDSLNLTQLNLMQYFKLSGYKTYAYLTGYHSGWYGLSAMYRNSCDYFYESTSEYGKAVDDDLVTVAEFESRLPEQNSFIYFHLLSAHDVGTREEQFRKFLPDKIGLQTSGYEPVVNHYDNGIMQADYAISRIFRHLEKNALLNNATIYIVGDHGNLFGEEGLYGHAGGLHPKLLEVPMLIYDPQSATPATRNIASIMDVAPSITQRFFNDVPGCWEGHSLFQESTDSTYGFKVTAATVKTSLYTGEIEQHKDSLTLQIFDKQRKPVKSYSKLLNEDWKVLKENGEAIP